MQTPFAAAAAAAVMFRSTMSENCNTASQEFPSTFEIKLNLVSIKLELEINNIVLAAPSDHQYSWNEKIYFEMKPVKQAKRNACSKKERQLTLASRANFAHLLQLRLLLF